MALANFDLDALREKIRSAYKADDPIFQKFRGYARRLKAEIKPLKTYSVNAVSFVSADGGDNRLVFKKPAAGCRVEIEYDSLSILATHRPVQLV